tara:strand:- start:175 stop:867 length:693 start_codon:yes stop_codon:yes gene_type:complete
MADRIPLIVDSSSNQVKELPAGDSIILADNEKLKVGTSSDLNLYHDGSNSFIDETGTGNLYVKSNSVLYAMGDDIRLMNAANSETLLQAVVNGAVTLRYDNATKFATSSTGVDVTGNIVYSGSSLTVEDTLTDGSTITWNAINSPVAKVTLAGNRTITVSNNLGTGQYISVLVIQDGTGSRTLTWNAMFEFKDDTAPTLTTTASKGDLFTFRYNGAKWLEVGRNQNLSLS